MGFSTACSVCQIEEQSRESLGRIVPKYVYQDIPVLKLICIDYSFLGHGAASEQAAESTRGVS